MLEGSSNYKENHISNLPNFGENRKDGGLPGPGLCGKIRVDLKADGKRPVLPAKRRDASL